MSYADFELQLLSYEYVHSGQNQGVNTALLGVLFTNHHKSNNSGSSKKQFEE